MKNTRMIGQWTYQWAKIQEDLLPQYFDTIDSTNTYAKSVATTSKHQLIIADFQTHGRGRGQNTWISPTQGASLLSSWVFDLNYMPQPILAPLIGLSVFEALTEIGGFPPIAMKAPNDIYIKDKKVCGILIENLSQGSHNRLIIGIGMNVFDNPNLETSSCIQSFRRGDIDDCAWNGFLIEFYKRLRVSLEEAKSSHLSEEKCKKILLALNQFELLEKKYKKVLPSGKIATTDGIISW